MEKGVTMGATAGVLALLAVIYLVAGTVDLHSSRFTRVHALASRLAASQLFHQVGTLCKILLGWYQSLVVLNFFPQLLLPADLEAVVVWIEEVGVMSAVSVANAVDAECSECRVQ